MENIIEIRNRRITINEIEGMDPVEGYIALYTALYDTVRKYTFNLRITGLSKQIFL